MTGRLLFVGDVHLGHGRGTEAGAALARLVEDNRGHHVVLLGDLLDLAMEGTGPLVERLDAIAAAHPALFEVLGTHVRCGGGLTYVAGNHDHEIARPEGRAWLRSRLGAVAIHPWFVRLGDLHAEHGHVWDPDNAPADPLLPGPDPLGVLLARCFVSGAREPSWLGDSERTPLDLLLRSLARHGLRAPVVIARYFRVAVGAVVGAGAPWSAPASPGERSMPLSATPFADRLRPILPRPTLASRWATWNRLYFGRVVVTLALAATALLAAVGAMPDRALALACAVLASVAVAAFASPNRYGGAAGKQLSDGAHAIARETGAGLVVMGHAHRPAAGPIYWNTGSFGLPPGPQRTYLEVLDGVPALRSVPRDVPAPIREDLAGLAG